jgi:hypothetical protein
VDPLNGRTRSVKDKPGKIARFVPCPLVQNVPIFPGFLLQKKGVKIHDIPKNYGGL